jgi:uncharacterized protein (TIGR02391 family)
LSKIPDFDKANLQAICGILGDRDSGLTGSQIAGLLQQCGIDDPVRTASKAYRLLQALEQRQRADGCGNHVGAFVQAAMNPVNYTLNAEVFESRRSSLNAVLSFSGITLGEDGKLRETKSARTLGEAQERAGRLRKKLLDRSVHADVLRFCRAELLQENYFHEVFEATKSVADKIREKSGLTSDGARLVDQAFGKATGLPLLAFNTLHTQAEQSEQTGLMNLLKGLFGTFRNTTAHAPKIKWVIGEQDALDMLSLASLLHRRLDGAVRTERRGS